MKKFTLIGVSRGALLVRDYNNISNLKDGTKELVDLCRQVLVLDEAENVIYEYDREYMKRSKETKAVIKEKLKEIYLKFNYPGSAKGTDLEKWFNVKLIKIGTKDGFEILK